MGVAHHSAYVSWLEECRIEMLRALGASYRALEERGIALPVIDLSLRYRRSLRFDDVATCLTAVTVAGPSRLIFRTELRLDDQLCAEGIVTLATVDRSGRPMRLPGDVAALLAGAAGDQASQAQQQ